MPEPGYVAQLWNLCKSQSDRALVELLATEETYLNDLETFLEYYNIVERDDLRLLTEDSIEAIFGNLKDLVTFQRRFYSIMLDCFKNSDFPVVSFEILFDSSAVMQELLDLYTKFCFNYHKAKCYVLLHGDALAKYNEYLKSSLESFMILPIQRICRYPLLLREICKGREPGHPYRRYLTTMHDIARSVDRALDSGINKMSQEDLLKQIRQYLGDLEDVGISYEHDLAYVTFGGGTEKLCICSIYQNVLLIFQKTKRKPFAFKLPKTFRQFTYSCHYLTSSLSSPTLEEDPKALSCSTGSGKLLFRFLTTDTRQRWYQVIDRLIIRKSLVAAKSLNIARDTSSLDLSDLQASMDVLQGETEKIYGTISDHWLPSFDKVPIYIQQWQPAANVEAVAVVVNFNHIGFFKPFLNQLAELGYAAIGWDPRGIGMTAKGGTFPNFLTGKSIDVNGEPQGKMHFRKTVEDFRCVIDAARQKFPGKKVVLIPGQLLAASALFYLKKYQGSIHIPDGLLFCPFAAEVLNDPVSWLAFKLQPFLYPHRQVAIAKKSSYTTRDANYLKFTATSDLATEKTTFGFHFRSFALLRNLQQSGNFEFLRKYKSPIGFLFATNDFVVNNEKSMHFVNTCLRDNNTKTWVIERGYHNILSDSARHPMVKAALIWMKEELNTS